MDSKILKNVKPFAGALFLQFGNAGFAIVAKAALNKGTSHYTFAVYRNAIAAALFLPFAYFLERKVRPRMTWSVFIKILLLALFDPVMGQNLFYAGMSYTSPTIMSALGNLVPGITFIVAWILRVERVNLKDIRTHAKILGTVVAVGGAMIMTLFVGPIIGLPWAHGSSQSSSQDLGYKEDTVRGATMLMAGYTGYSVFFVLQAITLKSYPAGLSLTSLICTFGALLGTILTFIMERGNTEIWALGWDAKLLGYAYGGIICSGIAYYVGGVVMQLKGPVFLTAFNPLSTVLVAILSSFIFAEVMTVGKVIGAVVIVMGLYMVIWGKKKDSKNVETKLPETQQNDKADPSSKMPESNDDTQLDPPKTPKPDDVSHPPIIGENAV